jgi:hypothetical protein
MIDTKEFEQDLSEKPAQRSAFSHPALALSGIFAETFAIRDIRRVFGPSGPAEQSGTHAA